MSDYLGAIQGVLKANNFTFPKKNEGVCEKMLCKRIMLCLDH